MLPRILMPLYGPFCIQSYGLMIALSLIISTQLLLRDKRRIHLISTDQFMHLLTIAIVIGIVGGRLLHVLSCYTQYDSIDQMLAIHEGGFSILGTTLTLLCILPWYLRRAHIPILPLFDLLATYAPLTQAIARLGCLFAGCCYGLPTTSSWAVTYTDLQSLAPLNVALHATQLYSSILFISIFAIMLICKRYPGWPGRDTFIFLSLFSAQRFLIDFWRGDRIFYSFGLSYNISLHQWIALCLGGAALLMLSIGTYYYNHKVQH